MERTMAKSAQSRATTEVVRRKRRVEVGFIRPPDTLSDAEGGGKPAQGTQWRPGIPVARVVQRPRGAGGTGGATTGRRPPGA
jgi:hypothetical protein